jgi:hypothetical protein
LAKIKLQGHASGTGVLTVTAPNTSTDRTITLPDATGTLLNSDGSGASLTALNATNLGSGIVPTARLGTGSASSSTFLRGDGAWQTAGASTLAALTDVTVSASNPATDTNPSSGVGHLWVQSTSGESYICTTATTDENVWTNIGSGSGDIAPIFNPTGGTITTNGGYTIHTFTSSGTFTPNISGTVEYLVVAGGGAGAQGGGGGAGGGGAGGYRTATGFAVAATGLTVTVGAGGAAASSQLGASGADSVFSSITSIGGGGGASNAVAAAGGSGGGGGECSYTAGGAGTAGQGNAGGAGWTCNYGGGGGGAGAVGTTSISGTVGPGGVGLASSINGSSVFRAGGGGASGNSAAGSSGGNGGGGNGGPGSGGSGTITSGAVNTGGGGGGTYQTGAGTASGGSGIVIIRYLTP